MLFRGSVPVLLRNPIALWFLGGGGQTPCPTSGSAHGLADGTGYNIPDFFSKKADVISISEMSIFFANVSIYQQYFIFTADNQLTTSVTPCHTWQFQCNNGMCIERYQRCDGYDNCGDYSDEHNCGKLNGLLLNLFPPSLSNSYTMCYPHVRGDNPRALASGL